MAKFHMAGLHQSTCLVYPKLRLNIVTPLSYVWDFFYMESRVRRDGGSRDQLDPITSPPLKVLTPCLQLPLSAKVQWFGRPTHPNAGFTKCKLSCIQSRRGRTAGVCCASFTGTTATMCDASHSPRSLYNAFSATRRSCRPSPDTCTCGCRGQRYGISCFAPAADALCRIDVPRTETGLLADARGVGRHSSAS
jgi:hypothetical protein